MASALSYVSKFKSFVILFVTPILLLPLIILMPAKVSCVSGQPRGFRVPGAQQRAWNLGTLGGANGFSGGTAPLRHAPSGAPGAMGGALQRVLKGMHLGVHRSQGGKNCPGKHRNLEISHTTHPQAQNLPLVHKLVPRHPSDATCIDRKPGCLFPFFLPPLRQ